MRQARPLIPTAAISPLVDISIRSIVSHRLIEDNMPNKYLKRQEIYDLYANIDGNLGIVRMNKEHRYNTLTSSFIDQVTRGISSMDIDHIVRMIYLGTAKHEHFSNGTDFRSIAYMKEKNDYESIRDYFQKLYRLQTDIAKTNKPIFAVASGHAKNSGACMLMACGQPMTTLDTKVAFNEVTFGFTPHSGAVYYLNKMPGDFGTFMALTGMAIHGSEACRVGIAEGVI
jgi:enoyl-CoA hydratase